MSEKARKEIGEWLRSGVTALTAVAVVMLIYPEIPSWRGFLATVLLLFLIRRVARDDFP